jgi:hypothetical protein
LLTLVVIPILYFMAYQPTPYGLRPPPQGGNTSGPA